MQKMGDIVYRKNRSGQSLSGLGFWQVGQESNLQPAVLENAAPRLIQSPAVSSLLSVRTQRPPRSRAISLCLLVLLSDMLSKQVALAVAGLWFPGYERALQCSPSCAEARHYRIVATL